VTANGSVFRLENMPVFYMPYVSLPSVDRERSTGSCTQGMASSSRMNPPSYCRNFPVWISAFPQDR
jgi:hypothetical protein